MKSTHHRAWKWLAVIVIGHLAISFIHGTAHARANISMSPAANLPWLFTWPANAG